MKWGREERSSLHIKENIMPVMTTIGFEKGDSVAVFTEGTWCKGVVTDVNPKSPRPVKVHYAVNGTGDEDWFGPDRVKSR